MTLEAEGSIGDEPLSIDAVGGNLLDGDAMERDPLRARIALGDTVASMNGTMSRDDLEHLNLSVSVEKSGNDGDHDFRVDFNVRDPGTHWRLSRIRASFGESTLAGYLEIGTRSGDRRFFGGRLSAANVHYPDEEEKEEPDGKTMSDVLPEGDLYSNILDFSEKFDADVRFDARNSTFLGVAFQELALHALLDRGELAAAIHEASIRDALLSATFNVTPQEDDTHLELQASLRDAPLAALVAGIDALDGVTGRFDGDVNLRAAGADTPSVLNSTAGRLVLFLEDGVMPDKLATRIAGDVFTAMFTDFDKDDTIPIHCAVVNFSIEQGLGRSEQIVMDTDAFNLHGSGEIRLGRKNLDIELEPRAKDFSLVSMRLPMRIHGPFDDVRFDPDVSEGVASLLTPIELGREGDSGCAPPPLSAKR